MTSVIECESCGREYETKASNAVVCRVCRLLLNTKYWYGKTRECVACDEKFAPLGSARDDPFCGDCAVRSSLHIDGTCVFCEQKTVLLHKDVKVCQQCARNPEQRVLFIKALTRKQREVRV